MVCVGRPIEGISINGLEWLLDADGEPMQFESEEAARDFLRGHGVTEFDEFVFEEAEQVGE